MMDNLKEQFKKIYKVESTSGFFSPGRINIIGRNSVVAGGNVLTASITRGIYAAVSKRSDNKILMYFTNFSTIGMISVDINNIYYSEDDGWANCLKGMIIEYQKKGLQAMHGLNILIDGDLPSESGLSCSSSLEVLMGMILANEYSILFDIVENIKAADACEKYFIGGNGGILDSFAIQMGRKDCAILLNTRTLDYSYAEVDLDKIDIVVMNAHKLNNVQNDKYLERIDEINLATKCLKRKLNFEELCDLSSCQLKEYAYLIITQESYKRARHVVSENERAQASLQCLNKGDVKAFGQILNESHKSLQQEWCVTNKEVDFLVQAAQDLGALGSKMTDYDNSVIMICYKEDTKRILHGIINRCQEEMGYEPTTYTVYLGDGSKRIY